MRYVATSTVGLAAVTVAVFGLVPGTPAPGEFGDPAVVDPSSTVGSATPGPGSAEEAAPAVESVPDLAEVLIIPALHVRAPVEPVDSRAGRLEIPDDPAVVGWWTGGALPGAGGGTVVLVGHVDSAGAGRGALFRLTTLRSGDGIVLVLRDHRQLGYTVYARRSYPKGTGLPADLFTPTGPPRLVLITCGGPFDETTHTYRDNVVVFAVPAG